MAFLIQESGRDQDTGKSSVIEPDGQTLLFDSPALLEIVKKDGWYMREDPCVRCGGLLFREIRNDCVNCHYETNRIVHDPMGEACNAAVRGKPIPLAALSEIGVSEPEFLSFLVRGCREASSCLSRYGKEWGVYRKIPPANFPLNALAKSNRIENLEIRPRHNQRKDYGNN